MARREMGSRPAGSGGNPNILDYRERDKIQVRILEPYVEEWRQYTIREKLDDDADNVRFIVARPNDPLARKGFRATKRCAVNVWDYESGEIKILMGGAKIFNEFDGYREAGLDPMAFDVVIRKTGRGRQTDYQVVRMDTSPMPSELGSDWEDQLHDLSDFDKAPSIPEIFKVLEEMQVDYDAIPLPTFTVDEAMVTKIPFGKHKGQEIKDVLKVDEDYLNWFVGDAEKRGNTGGDIYVAVKTVLTNGEFDPYEGVPRAADYVDRDGASDRADTTPPASQPAPAQAPPPAAADEDEGEPETAPEQAPADEPAPAPAAQASFTPATDDDVKGEASFRKWLTGNGLEGTFSLGKNDDGKWVATYEDDDEDLDAIAAGRKLALMEVADRIKAKIGGVQPETPASQAPADEDEPAPASAESGEMDIDALRADVKDRLQALNDFHVTAKLLEAHADGNYQLDALTREQLESLAAAPELQS